MNISILSSTQHINNSSIKHANTMWQGSRVQGYAEALIHILIKNYQKDYTTLEIPQNVIQATKNFIMRCDHIVRFFWKKISSTKITISPFQSMNFTLSIKIGIKNLFLIDPLITVWKIFVWI